MAADTYTEVSSQSWFGRIGNSIKGIVFGLLLFIVAFPVLFLNEGRAVKRYKTLNEGGGLVQSVAADSVDSGNNGKLIHITGQAVTEDTPRDTVFGVSAAALKLKRTVEMYQWRESERSETRKKLGGGTETVKTYSYNKAWSSSLIDSSRFHKSAEYRNPDSMPYRSEEWVADPIMVGAFTLSPSLASKIGGYVQLPLSSDTPIPAELQGKMRLEGSGYYIGNSAASPEIGDVRITFQSVPPMAVSIMAGQVGQTFEPFTASTGGTIELLQAGTVSADAMIQKAQHDNMILTWILRAVGFFLMFIGLSMVFKPLSVMGDVLPFLGSLIGAGVGIVAFLLASTLSLVTVAIAWIAYRPVVGISILAGAVVLVVLTRLKVKAARPAHTAETA